MELDVHLTRESDDPWGFDFIGGSDSHVPLAVDKVIPGSPAHRAGLQTGDVVARIGDRLTAELSLECAFEIVAESVASLSLGICRGLYDPVLDDFEPIYEPIDRADSDLRSEPTEVYPDLSYDSNILDSSITDLSLWDSGYATRPLTETRSLTASPFVPNSKPYRPFSTDPLEVPPLDDPIILNPNYKDIFNLDGNAKLDQKEDDLLLVLPLDGKVDAKFKLPVSEKYDPDWDKKVRALLEKCAESGKRDSEQIERELANYSDRSKTSTVALTKEISNRKAASDSIIQEHVVSENEIIKKKVKLDEIKEEISIKKIEQVASEVVEESIERAIYVTEDIQKEMAEERASMAKELTEKYVEENEATSEINIHIEELQTKENRKQSAGKNERIESVQDETETSSRSKQKLKIDEVEEKTTNQKSETNITESEEIKESLAQDQKFVEERKLSIKKEMEETIESGNVRRKSSVFEKQDTNINKRLEDKENLFKDSTSAETDKNLAKVFGNNGKPIYKGVEKNPQPEEINPGHARKYTSSGILTNDTSEGKQKAYLVGLQTIPHIKGFVQSSYHFDLLLRTFFVHLTDVMVALSRFILTQPAQELELKGENVIKEKLTREFNEQDKTVERKEIVQKCEDIGDNMQSFKKNKLQVKQETDLFQAKQETKLGEFEMQKNNKEIQEIKQKRNENITKSDHVIIQELSIKQHDIEIDPKDMEMRKKTGAEMAQRTQRKSRDLTQKMDAVITEFENKTGIEDRLEVTEQRRRRSRSRSQIEEEAMSESDPLEWLDKVDSRRASQERSGIVIEKGFSSYAESKECKKSETKRESRITKMKPGKQMYIAIVESHVYTNRDAILEDQATEMSETASVQSSEEINSALESFETISTENVAMSDIIQTEGKQQAVEVITNALQEVVQEKQEPLETVTDFKSQINKQDTKTVMQESLATLAAESTEIISESKVEEFKASERKKPKALSIREGNYKTAAVGFIDVPLEATKELFVETKSNKQQTISRQEELITVAAETTENVDESKLESFKSNEIISKQAVLSSEENYKTAAENITAMVLEASKEEVTEFKVKEHQAIPKVESLAIAVAQSTDVVGDDSSIETFECAELLPTKALVKAEEPFKTAALGVTEVTFETAEEKHSEQAKTSEVAIKEEAQHLAVAGIIETKTKLCKEPKIPAQDEYASLKIVKEQIIDGGESVQISSQSELNVKKSLEVDMSNSQQLITQPSYQSISRESNLMHNMSSSVQEIASSVQEISSSVQEISSSAQEISSSVQELSIPMQQNSKSTKSLHIDINLAHKVQQQICDQIDENNNTPTPSTVPPTPLTDEYIFKLEIPLPKNQGTVIVEDSPDREDPHIVKKGLIPYIETIIEDQIIYDPPLPTPPEDKVQSPVYTKPGLKGGSAPLFKKEYIREIERKSSLLASAIDETIKSIEEYKEEVGIATTTDVTVHLTKNTDVAEQSKKKKAGEETITNGITKEHEDIDSTEKRIEDNNQYLSEDKSKLKDGLKETDSAKESEALPGFKPVVFNPETYQANLFEEDKKGTEPAPVEVKPYVDESGEPLGTVQGIVDGLEDATVDEEVAKELGKPGLPDEKISELISGESEMLREAHVMGLNRVLTSHMTRPDDSCVDFQKIKPLYESLKHSEVLKALNEELMRENELKKKKEEKKWTTFLQKPKRPVPRERFGYNGSIETEDVDVEEPYKVKIVKQPKPKVAPDYKPEDFDTGPLPWEQRALIEPVPSPIPPEEPILVPEEAEFFEAIDPLPESEVPDLEDTGIPLPATPPPVILAEFTEVPPEPAPEPIPEPKQVDIEEPPQTIAMDQNAMAEHLVNTVKGMVDPNASLEQQLCQMRAQLSALAQLPCVIQHSLELLTQQLSSMGRQETNQMKCETQMNMESQQETHENNNVSDQECQEQVTQNNEEVSQNHQKVEQNGHQEAQREEERTLTIEEVQEPKMTAEEAAAFKREHDAMIEKQWKSEKEKKERQEKARLDQESRQLKQRAPRVGKPRPVFGPLSPEERPLVLPGGRRWRGPKDAYNEQLIDETIQAQSEIIQGKVMGYESDRLPYDHRINFMKYEKPPVNLEHLQNSATYKLIHNLEDAPLKRTDLLKPVISEADYRERCRSATPKMQTIGRM